METNLQKISRGFYPKVGQCFVHTSLTLLIDLIRCSKFYAMDVGGTKAIDIGRRLSLMRHLSVI